MQITQLNWMENVIHGTSTWIGTGTGIWATVRITVQLVDGSTDDYTISSTLKQIDDIHCIGLEAAKEKAQAIINAYALSQAIL